MWRLVPALSRRAIEGSHYTKENSLPAVRGLAAMDWRLQKFGCSIDINALGTMASATNPRLLCNWWPIPPLCRIWSFSGFTNTQYVHSEVALSMQVLNDRLSNRAVEHIPSHLRPGCTAWGRQHQLGSLRLGQSCIWLTSRQGWRLIIGSRWRSELLPHQ